MDTRHWSCPTCAQDRLFQQPPCAERHTDEGGECPEWACVDCGTAVFGEPVARVRLRSDAA